ncbi:sulfurtransferase TusA family protein [Spongiibacter nanhainus]|uniref:Sulfurtransferase TusA family protein n=1 Tax=Spongiibacter nanhainus TaxID=2794344 RepID=A0A7T4QY53_9GAMM|nr:sulfurtransferase TusA family protein [Spongiibacter nanhainus]QQD16886.1 sulfurtransferase TusA family protein [Spongiibacter nanhainus]
MTDIAQRLDASGLDCPLPLLKAKQALNRMQSGERLEVVATDPGSQRDFDAFCRQSGNILHLSEHDAQQYRYIIEKRAD